MITCDDNDDLKLLKRKLKKFLKQKSKNKNEIKKKKLSKKKKVFKVAWDESVRIKSTKRGGGELVQRKTFCD